MTDIRQIVEQHGFLQSDDGVGISFWIISIAMVASTVFFFCEAQTVGAHWKTSLHVGMLAFGYLGEQAVINPWAGFACGMAGWFFILFEIFAGEGGQVANGKDLDQYTQSAFNTMRFIVSMGWSIYPLGYFAGYLMHSVHDNTLNLVYNLADMLNKIWFVLAIWHAAKCESQDKAAHALLS